MFSEDGNAAVDQIVHELVTKFLADEYWDYKEIEEVWNDIDEGLGKIKEKFSEATETGVSETTLQAVKDMLSKHGRELPIYRGPPLPRREDYREPCAWWRRWRMCLSSR